MTTAMTAILRLAASLWLGGVGIFTFFLTPLIFANENRDAAGRIVGYLFPGYFRWGLGCGVVALIAIVVLGRKLDHFRTCAALALLMTTITAFQGSYIEPKAAALKREIPSFVTTPKEHPLRRKFAKLHGISAVCNLTVFAGGVALVVLL
jgi:hypothetical protein